MSTLIKIQWEGPRGLEEARRLNDEDEDYGLYMIYGTHVIFDRDSLLYIGKSADQSFGQRFSQHEKWLDKEEDIQIFLGRIDEDSEQKWQRLVSVAERLLIYYHSPPYNSEYINSHSVQGDYRIMNLGSFRDLVPEISTRYLFEEETHGRPTNSFEQTEPEILGFPLETRGGEGKRKAFCYLHNPQTEEIKIRNEDGRFDVFTLREIHKILESLQAQFGNEFFPLANNVILLKEGKEQPGLGRTILTANRPGDISHAQAASYLGVLCENLGLFEWNGRRKNIAWRLLGETVSIQNLKNRLQSLGARKKSLPSRK